MVPFQHILFKQWGLRTPVSCGIAALYCTIKENLRSIESSFYLSVFPPQAFVLSFKVGEKLEIDCMVWCIKDFQFSAMKWSNPGDNESLIAGVNPIKI